MLARSAGAEEVERLLNFEHNDFGHLLQDRRLRVILGRAHLASQLQRLEAQIQFLLQRIGVLMPAHRNVAREQRRRAFHDVDVHHARTQVEQRDDLGRSGFIVELVAVLQCERIDIHNSRSFAGHREYVGVVQNLVFLDSHEQDVHLRTGRIVGKNLVVEVHVR